MYTVCQLNQVRGWKWDCEKIQIILSLHNPASTIWPILWPARSRFSGENSNAQFILSTHSYSKYSVRLVCIQRKFFILMYLSYLVVAILFCLTIELLRPSALTTPTVRLPAQHKSNSEAYISWWYTVFLRLVLVYSMTFLVKGWCF